MRHSKKRADVRLVTIENHIGESWPPVNASRFILWKTLEPSEETGQMVQLH